MPPAEIVVDEDVVRALLAQLPDSLADAARFPVRLVGDGWDNTCFRLGEDLLVRVPRQPSAVPLLQHEVEWLPRLAALVSVAVSEPVFVGRPTSVVPWPWTVNRWVPGDIVLDLAVASRGGLVDDLADALVAIHSPAPPEAPANPWRGVSLAARSKLLADLDGGSAEVLPVVALQEAWARGLAAAVYQGPPVWLHGDPHPMNLLHVDGRLSGVIDFGDLTAGDPASDLATAWMTFGVADRARFRRRLDATGQYDEAVWVRAAAWAASMASRIGPGTPLSPVLDHVVAQLELERELEPGQSGAV